MHRIKFRVMALMLLSSVPLLSTAGVQRELRLNITLDATQDWRNELQWGKATTQQKYVLSTELRSDGRLYPENLLNPDFDRRIAFKTEFYTYQGLVELRQEFGGRLPKPDEVSAELSIGSLTMGEGCIPGHNCPNASPQRYAAIAAVQSRSPEELAALIAKFEAPGGRWLYFGGFSGCGNQLQIDYQSHFAGERAFDRARKNLKPFEMDWKASEASPEDQATLCKRYTVTVDTESNQMYIENVYLPSPLGHSTRKTNSYVDNRDRELPPAQELMSWVNEVLAKAPLEGARQDSLKLTLPLDGDSTVLGSFEGAGKASLSWSFR